MPKPVILVVLDGWGLSSSPDNIVNQVSLPTFDILNQNYPMAALQASGISVGLPWGEAGNSEVGHMTMGAGRIMYQNLPRISLAIQDGTFNSNAALATAAENCKKSGALHIMGLVGDGAVHSSRDHLYALLRFAKNHGLTDVYVHLFTDGRDSSPKAAGDHVIRDITSEMEKIGVGKIASVIGRSLAMDRNNNWDRIKIAYDMLTKGTGAIVTDPIQAVKESYAADLTDEYVAAHVVSDDGTKPRGLIKDGDTVIFFNYREDRARQLTKAFVLPDFDKFDRGNALALTFVTMVEYENDLPVSVAFPTEDVHNSVGETLSKAGLKQLRISETEKYAHVTYFFNAGHEEPFDGEDHVLIPSPAVERFDEKPEMSSPEITETLVQTIATKDYDFILVNYANADMVAHTGNEQAAKLAIACIDQCLKKLIKATLAKGGQLLITADHGNVEVMHNPHSGAVDTQHNDSPIPLWYITPTNHRTKTPAQMTREQTEIRGLLSDVAPTLLDIFDIEEPKEMQGESLLATLA